MPLDLARGPELIEGGGDQRGSRRWCDLPQPSLAAWRGGIMKGDYFKVHRTTAAKAAPTLST